MRKNKKGSSYKKPYNQIIRVRNNGKIEAYDVETGNGIELDSIDNLLFLENTFNWRKAVFNNKNKLTAEYYGSEYRDKKEDRIYLSYKDVKDSSKNYNKKGLVFELEDIKKKEKLGACINVYACDLEGNITKVEFTATGRMMFLLFKEDVGKEFTPDFSMSMRDKTEEDETVLGVHEKVLQLPQFTHIDINLTEEQESIIDKASEKVESFLQKITNTVKSVDE